MFTGVCLSTGGYLFQRGCLVLSQVGGYLVWWGGCLVQGVPAPRGAGLGGACFWGVPAPGGGGCLVRGVPGGDPPDGYCCGRYASHWNSFLFIQNYLFSGRLTLEFLCGAQNWQCWHFVQLLKNSLLHADIWWLLKNVRSTSGWYASY